MQPICQSLDILQSETKAFLGCLVPTISMAMKKLKELKSSNKIAVGLPLIDSLIQAIESRFGQYFENETYLLATNFYPQFRLLWIPWYFNEPLEIEARLKQKMIDILEKEGNVAESFNSDTDNDHDETTSDTLFGCLFSKQMQRNSSAADRINKFLSANPTKIVDLKAFSDEDLKKILSQIQHWAAVASAAVQHFKSKTLWTYGRAL